MKTWKLVSGILSIVITFFVLFQSCAVGFYNSVAETGMTSGTSGFIVAFLLLTGGIVSISTREGGKGGNVAQIILFGFGALIGLTMSENYEDLQLWGGWCALCAIISIVALFMRKKESESVQSEGEPDIVMEPVKKKVPIIPIVVGVVVVFALIVIIGGSDNDSDSRGNATAGNDDPQEPREVVVPGAGALGDYYVEIKGATLAEDYEGNPAIVFTYAWTNNSEKTTSAMVTILERAFQDGVELDSAFMWDSPAYSGENNSKEVRPGTTVDIQKAYTLTSYNTVEFELSEAFSWSDAKVAMNFDLTGQEA